MTESQIFYTKEFKEEFWRRYQAGETPRAIVEALGYDPDMLGQYRINGLQINIQKQAQRPEGFTQGKGHHKGRKAELYDVDNNPTDENFEYVVSAGSSIQLPTIRCPGINKKIKDINQLE